MKEQLTVLTRKGQTTIPVEIRRELGLREGDRIAWILDRDGAHISREESVTERTRGVFRHAGPPLSAEDLRLEAERSIAGDVIERSRG
jgi:AbrB family looped-hinge helix DNA binding protein